MDSNVEIIDSKGKSMQPKPWYTRGGFITLIIIGVLTILATITFIHDNNEMAKAEQNVDEQLGQVQTVIQRRADLIPNLVNAVKGQQKQEQKVYGLIAKARTAYYNAQKDYSTSHNNHEKVADLATQDKALNILVGSIKESYPDLKSNQNMSNLMVEIEGSENRISVERNKYNQKVNTYNNMLVTFPKSMVANVTNHHPAKYFQASDTSQSAPRVNF